MKYRALKKNNLEVFIIQALTDNYVYLLSLQDKPGMMAIDPSEATPVLQFLNEQNKSLSWILNTHHHHDHVGGNVELKNKFNCQIMCSAYDKQRVPAADQTFVEKGAQNVHGLNFTPIMVPGHTLGHTALHFSDFNILASGDTLFSLGCGRLFEGTHKQLYNSLQKLKTLPQEALVLCGHEYTARNSEFTLAHSQSETHRKEVLRRAEEVAEALRNNQLPMPTTLGWELENNLFLLAKNFEEFRELRMARDHFVA